MAHPWTVRTYRQLQQFTRDFAVNKELQALIVVGPPGVGKTETVRLALEGQFVVLLRGRLSARELFNQIRDNPDALFVLDDTRALLQNAECVNLLMALAEAKPEKVVQWNISAKGDSAGPTSVTTRSRVIILTNDAREDDETLEPLFSRAVVVKFLPSKREAHAYIGTWFVTDERKEEVYNYIGRHLSLVPAVDAREYKKAAGLFGMEWKDYLHQSWSGDEHVCHGAGETSQ